MHILIRLDSQGLYEAVDSDNPEETLLGKGTSPDEALGELVRLTWLAIDCAVVDDISSKED